MLDPFLLLTPILLLAVIALLGFIGCNPIFGLDPVVLAVRVDGVNPSSGSPTGGTMVTINGSGFESGPTVKFGGIDAAVINSSDSLVTVATPAHPTGIVDVAVTNSEGTTGTLQGGFTYEGVKHLDTVTRTVTGGPTTGSVTTGNVGADKTIVVTISWGGAATPSLSGASFAQVGTTDNLGPQHVANFYATHVTTPITVTVNLSGQSSTPLILVVSTYDNADPASPPDTPQSAQNLTSTPFALLYPTTVFSAFDLVYSVAVARVGSVLGGSLSRGGNPIFTAEVPEGSYFLVQDRALLPTDIADTFTVGASDASPMATSNWYLFAMHIKHA
jgi:hypothetical protein